MIKIIFWFSIGLISYTYFGYPIILTVLSLFITKPVKKKEITPFVSLLIAVYNEEKTISTKINNVLSLDYPKGKLEILIGSDSSTDKTDEIIKQYNPQGIKFCRIAEHKGKVNVLNKLVLNAKGEIIVFTDARQRIKKNAIKELANNFADEHIGCVSGELVLEHGDESSVGEGMQLYWNYEKFLRKKESQIGSMLGATGAIYAIRKDLYVSPQTETLLDDVFIPMKIIEKGYRVIFDSCAKAYDKVSKDVKEEVVRKIRTLAGNWQIFFIARNMFNPLKSSVAIQLFSHKLLRLLIPYFLLIVYITNIFLLSNFFYAVFFVLQTAFYLAALIGFFLLKHKIKAFSIPYLFCVLNITAMQGLYAFIRKNQKVTWRNNQH